MLAVADVPAARFVVAGGAINFAAFPVVVEGVVALNGAADEGAVVVAPLAGAGGLRTAISADRAALKPSPLASAAGKATASPGGAIGAALTWVEAASMAPVKEIVRGGGACCASEHSTPSSNPCATGSFPT